jgi:TPP-dependent pyruvate/acetoin dehydrogenase alpha subunit
MNSLSPNLPPDTQREMLRRMLTIRRFEERASADYLAGKIYGVVHCYIGEEAVAVGVCSALRRTDRIISTHRGHGHCIAKGADLNRMMAELYGRQAGYCKGKGGSMHIADFGIGMLGANGIVAGGISIVTGAGLAAQMEGAGGVAVSFLGDGASNAGPFHECLNIAAAWKLPMLYVCENNMYAAQTAAAATHALSDVAAQRRRLRHPRRRRRWQRRVRRASSGGRGDRPGPFGRWPDADRVQDLSLACPHRAARPARPARSSRDRGVAAQRPGHAAGASAARAGRA